MVDLPRGHARGPLKTHLRPSDFGEVRPKQKTLTHFGHKNLANPMRFMANILGQGRGLLRSRIKMTLFHDYRT